jgi:hypothetical protein
LVGDSVESIDVTRAKGSFMNSVTLQPDDVKEAARLSFEALAPAVERDWELPAAGLEWTCRYTLDHIVAALVIYSGDLATNDPGQHPILRPEPTNQSIEELLGSLPVAAALLAAVCTAAADDWRGFHPSGIADWSGFAAMGCTETLCHTDDIARAFGIDFQPGPEIPRKVLDRIFPWTPKEGDGWQILRWATGRGDLPGRDPIGSGWGWHSAPLSEWDGTIKRSG